MDFAPRKTGTHPASRPVATNPAARPVAKPVPKKPAVKSSSRPASRPTASRPAHRPVTRPAVKSATKSATRTVSKKSPTPVSAPIQRKSPAAIRRATPRRISRPVAEPSPARPVSHSAFVDSGHTSNTVRQPKKPSSALRRIPMRQSAASSRPQAAPSSRPSKATPRKSPQPQPSLEQPTSTEQIFTPSEVELDSQSNSAAITREVSALISHDEQDSIVEMSVDETVVMATPSDQPLSADLAGKNQPTTSDAPLNDFIAEVEPLEIDKITNSESTAQEFETADSSSSEFESGELASPELEAIDSPVSEFGEDELENLEEAFSELEDSGVELEEMIDHVNNNTTMGLTDFEDLKSTPIEKSPFLAVEVEKRPLSAHRVEMESPVSQPEVSTTENSPVSTPSPAPAPENIDSTPAPASSSADSTKNPLSKLKSLPKKNRIKKNYKGKSRNTIALVIAISIALALGVCAGVLIYFIFFQE
ncbi:MAG: hypothetical protein Q4F60_01575 [Candidatus Saccharibacteria bacterium]|nr:hypothetical protein [Candidatus Saccharibacteria bacterium]